MLDDKGTTTVSTGEEEGTGAGMVCSPACRSSSAQSVPAAVQGNWSLSNSCCFVEGVLTPGGAAETGILAGSKPHGAQQRQG